MPKGALNPVVAVVTDVGLSVAIETEPPKLAVQICEPSKAIPKGLFPRELDSVVTIPAGCVGSIIYRLPGFVAPATKILPIAATMALSLAAPVQVSSTFPLPGV